MKKYSIFFAAAAMLFASCDDFLTREPKDQMTDQTYWSSEGSVRAFAFGLYSEFVGYGNGGALGAFYNQTMSDDIAARDFAQFDQSVPATSSLWDFSSIRKANVLINRVSKMSTLEESTRNHWMAVGRFFRAQCYYELVQNYGGVPWVDKEVMPEDEDMLYKARDSREVVMDNVLADLQFAIEHLRVDDGKNRVNKDCAYALMSRVGLFEGTFRKYHGLTESEKFLKASKDASAAIINSGSYSLHPTYVENYNSKDLGGNKEMILYKKYENSVLTHGTMGYLVSSTTIHGLTKNAVESYPCTDGVPATMSDLYEGDGSLEDVIANRDARLMYTIDPSTYVFPGYDPTGTGTSATTGYKTFKFVNFTLDKSEWLSPSNTTDGPLFWLSEVMVNYAEACAELDAAGQYAMTQADLDMSVNKLREIHGKVAPLQLLGKQQAGTSAFGVINDPKNTDGVSSLIYEIRRERRIELMLDGFRFWDLMRWKLGKYLDTTKNPDIFKGVNTANIDLTGNTTVILEDGYVVPYQRERVFDEAKHYLKPIPSKQIILNDKLVQNPGW